MRFLLVHNHYQQPGGEDGVARAEQELLSAFRHRVIEYVRDNDEILHDGLWGKATLVPRTVWAWDSYREIRALLRRIGEIEVEGTRDNLNRQFYIAGGSWYGNDTIWRMVYDFNKIILYAPREGPRLQNTIQREYVAIVDGIVAGEGNGPCSLCQ